MYEDNISEMLKKCGQLMSFLPDSEFGQFCREVISDCQKWFENKDPELVWDIYSKAIDSANDPDFSDYLQKEDDPLYYAICCACFDTVCYVTQAAIKDMDGEVLPQILDMFQDSDGLKDWEPEFLEGFSSDCKTAFRIAMERGL